MQPAIGRIVHYRLSAFDAERITETRLTSALPPVARPIAGNQVREGDVYPAVIVRIFGNSSGSAVNPKVLLDGEDIYWATSRSLGEAPGFWSWPPRT